MSGSARAQVSPGPPSNLGGATVLDLVGVGFGPSNLALAATLKEEAERVHGRSLSCLFFERKPEFAWHPAMLLPEATIQLTFLKDLVTLRNPQSRFTFLNYLRHRDRLDEFANLRKLFPSRTEFNDYYRWVAEQLGELVRYRREVEEITPVEPEGNGPIRHLRILVRDPSTGIAEEYLTRNLVLADGGSPVLPSGIEKVPTSQVLHFENFLPRLREGFPADRGPYTFVVVGSGQTAAEIFYHLMSTYPDSRVTAALRRFAYKPADDSHFVNEIFFPETVDFLYDLSDDKRQRLLDTHRDTNYSAVDLDLIEKIYEELYERRVRGEGSASIRPFLELRSLDSGGGRVQMRFQDLMHDRLEMLEADAVALATGVLRQRRHPLLEPLRPWLITDNGDGYRTQRDYRLATEAGFSPQICLQGFCERTHGLSDTLLSVLPFRTMEILEALEVDPGSVADTEPELRREAL